MIRVACLVCTNRPEWKPWWRHQIEKQEPFPEAEYLVCSDGGPGGIAEKRSELVQQAAFFKADFIAWFDDDDWSHPSRLRTALEAFDSPMSNVLAIDAVGSVRASFIDSRPAELKDARCIEYQAPEGIIFNGAVFRTESVPSSFNQSLTTGEDTEWLGRWLDTSPNYLIVGGPMHAWLCHDKNTTNKATERSFDSRVPRGLGITEDEWRLVPR